MRIKRLFSIKKIKMILSFNVKKKKVLHLNHIILHKLFMSFDKKYNFKRKLLDLFYFNRILYFV